jgi:vitamin B12 transporter
MLARTVWPLLVFSSTVFAQDDAVVVTASRTEQRLRDAIPHTTVLTRREIEDSQAVDVPSLLRREAGVEVRQNGGIGGVSALFMRGNRSSQSLVLVDGVRVEDAGFSTSAIQHLMLDDIDRIEIVRGNVSSLYGSGAIGGVVQIFTRQAQGAPAPYGEATAGSRATGGLRAGYGGELGAVRFNVTAARFDTRGFSQIDPQLGPAANPDADGYRNESASGNLAWRLGARHSVGASFLASRGRADTDGVDLFSVPPDAPQFTHRSAQDLGMLQGWWEARFVERWKSRITVAQGTDYRTDQRNGSFDNRSNTRSRQLIWDHELRLAPSHQLTAGLERLRQKLANEGSFAVGNRARDVEVLRAGYLGRFGAHSLQANARTEEYSDFGRADSYFLGYGLDLTEAWRFTAATSTAFRAPTFQDLFGFGGNPALEPERARTHELGIQWARGSDRVRVVAFDTEYRDAISFDPVSFTAANVGRASVTGWETSYSARLWGIDLRASLTLQDPIEGPDNARAVRRAKRFGAISAARSFGRWRLGADFSAAGAHRDFHIATGVDVRQAGHEVLNLMARYAFSRELFAALRVENALDKDYSLVHGYNTAPRGAFLTVGWQP